MQYVPVVRCHHVDHAQIDSGLTRLNLVNKINRLATFASGCVRNGFEGEEIPMPLHRLKGGESVFFLYRPKIWPLVSLKLIGSPVWNAIFCR